MLRFYAGSFVTLMRDLQIVACLFSEQINKGNGQSVLMESDRQTAIAALHNLELMTEPLPLSKLIHTNLADLQRRLGDDATMTFERAAVRIKLLHDDICKDLASGAYFLMFDFEEAKLYEQPNGSVFGLKVIKRFRKAEYDIQCASQCLALGQGTAAVFHLMRASEQVMRRLAQGLNIPNVVIKDWETALRDIDKALKALAGEPRTAKRDRKLNYYSEARNDLGSFKHGWRNYVMHSHTNYKPDEARVIFNAVQSFMQRLAEASPR